MNDETNSDFIDHIKTRFIDIDPENIIQFIK